MTKSCPLSHNSCLGDRDSSRHLPAELLAYLFIFIARDSYINEKYRYSCPTGPSWVNVSYVCRYWRDVALNFPTLWSYIPETSQCWTEELLARSQMAPLKISIKVTTIYCHYNSRQVLSIVEQVMKHSQRIQKLRLDVLNSLVRQEIGYQILSKFLSAYLTRLQHLEISHFNFPDSDRTSWSLFEENTPAHHTLKLKHCSIPWYALKRSDLTTLHLCDVGIFIHENTMAEFLAMLRRMPHLVQLSVHNSLPRARDFLFSGELNATSMISLPHLSNMSITCAPLSAATALLSCVDIPLRAKVHLEVEKTSEHTSTLDDYVRLASLLAQRIGQSNFPKFRSLTIGSTSWIVLAFSTSECVEWHSSDSLFSIGSDDNVLLKVIVVSAAGTPMNGLSYPVLNSICSQIPLTNIESVHFCGSSFKPECWRDILPSLSNVRHIGFSRYGMPNITSMLSLPSHDLTISSQDDRTDGGQGEIFLPALEELELYRTTLKRVCGRSDPDPYIADVQALYDAISTRKETRCRLTIKECSLMSVGRVVGPLESAGWWEGAEFRVTSNV